VDGAWVEADSSDGFDDRSAPPPRLLAWWAEASTDREDGVLLTARGFLTQLGAPRSYRVRVRPDGGGGEPVVSEVVTGSREAPPGSVAIRWQFLPADGPGEWMDLAGATGREHLDTTVGRGAGRVYRAEVSLYETTRATDRVVGQRR
jgi:hypothetical protein